MQPAQHVSAMHLGVLGFETCLERLHAFDQGHIVFDQHAVGCAPRQGLKAEHTGAGEQIETACAG